MRKNFKEEILDVLKFYDKTTKDIEWLGLNGCVIENDIENFLSLADIEHKVGFGCPTIYDSFLIVGKDWWIEVDDYDGYQDLVFRTKPSKPEKTVRVNETQEFFKSLRGNNNVS